VPNKPHISDCKGTLNTAIEGHLHTLVDYRDGATRLGFINTLTDVTTIGELINTCGYTTNSVQGKHIRITIEEIE
jgi:hypothetical protein